MITKEITAKTKVGEETKELTGTVELYEIGDVKNLDEAQLQYVLDNCNKSLVIRSQDALRMSTKAKSPIKAIMNALKNDPAELKKLASKLGIEIPEA